MGVEVKFVVYGDAKVFCCVVELKRGVVYVVSLVQSVLGLISDLDDLAFVRVEFHFVVCFPCLECVQVFLKDVLVFFGANLSVEEAVVCEESNEGARGEVGADVVYVDEEEEGAENGSLGYSGEDGGWVGF